MQRKSLGRSGMLARCFFFSFCVLVEDQRGITVGLKKLCAFVVHVWTGHLQRQKSYSLWFHFVKWHQSVCLHSLISHSVSQWALLAHNNNSSEPKHSKKTRKEPGKKVLGNRKWIRKFKKRLSFLCHVCQQQTLQMRDTVTFKVHSKICFASC